MLYLVTEGQSAYRIILPETADATLNHAAQELARYMARISGAILPIAGSGSPAAGSKIPPCASCTAAV